MKWLFHIVFYCVTLVSYGQRATLELNYAYLYSPQLDRAIQTYNFSRPFLQTKQPLLQHGIGMGASHYRKKDKKRDGFQWNYCFASSYAKNDLYENQLNLHSLQLNYITSFFKHDSSAHFSSEIHLGLRTTALFRRINQTPFIVDERRMMSVGIGAHVGYKLLFHSINRLNVIQPFLYFGIDPLSYSPNHEPLINGTKTLVSGPWSTILSSSVGLKLDLKPRSQSQKLSEAYII